MKYPLPNVIARLYLSIAAASLLLLSLAQPAWAGFTVSNGTVTDAVTSLVWDQCPQGLSTTTTACDTGSASTFSTWADALKAAVTANATSGGYKGFSDWRLPNVKELESIAKLDQYGPATDTTAFPGTPPSGFWTSTNYAPHGEWVWSVNFKYGTSVTDYKTKTAPPYSLSPNYVRLVRSGQFLATLDSLSPTVTVTSISPSSGPTAGGTSITISGTGFVSGATVTNGGTAATNVVFGSATSLTATTPALSAGAKDVVVTNPDTQTGTLINGFTYVLAPSVTSISPGSGTTAGGTAVTITGTNLTGASAVTLGGNACTPLSANSATSVTCTTAAHAAGTASVLVTTAGGTNAANTLYTYAVPTYSVTYNDNTSTGGSVPTDGATYANGASVTVLDNTGTLVKTGYTFNGWNTSANGSGTAQAAASTFTMGGAAVTLYARWTINSYTVTFDANTGTGTMPAQSVNYNVATALTANTLTKTGYTFTGWNHFPNGSGTAFANSAIYAFPANITLYAQWTLIPAPTVTAISPGSGPIAGGTSVTITGTNFVTGATTATIDGSACASPLVSSTTSMTCTTPSGSAGTAKSVLVTTAGGTNAANTLYAYVAAPTVSSIDPPLGPVAGRTTVTITGTGFTGATAVKFGSANASGYTVNSATQITATSPAAAAATVDVTVVTAGGTSATSSADHFLYIAAPTVTSISPSSGPTAGGTSVTITGTNLDGPNSLNGVTIGGLAGFDWTSRTSAADNSWSGVTYGNGLFVAVSYDGASRVMTSADGITWTPHTAAAASTWQSVTYGNGLFVAVSSDGTDQVMTSPDGITWTSRTSAADKAWRSVTYGNGLFVAVALDVGTYQVMTSPDGINWTPRTAAAASAWRSVTYGNGLFVAVAADGADQVMTSPNGINWTSRTAAAANTWVDVTYGNGLFVAVATAGNDNRVMTSPDAVTWTSRASTAYNWWLGVTYGNGLFVAVSYDGVGNRVMTSPDGNNWTSQAAAAANGWTKVTYGNGLFVAVAYDGVGNRVMTSSRSVAATITSSSDTSITATTPPGIAGTASVRVTTSGGTSAANSLYTYVVVPAPTVTSISPSSGPLAGGSSVTLTGTGFTGATGVTIGPQAGINWTSQAAAAANMWTSVTYGNGLFVAVSYDGVGNRVMTSLDGISWTSQTSPAGNAPVSVTYGNGRFVAVGSGCTESETGKCVMFSPDGINWGQSPAPANAWTSVTYGNGLFVAVADTGIGSRVMTSPDGFDWTSRTSAADNAWNSVTYGNGLFVAVARTGGGDRVMTSPDGITWTSQASAADKVWYSVTYGSGLFVAVAFDGTGNDVMTSPNGVTWTSRASAVGNVWMGVSYGNGLFVAVGYFVVGAGGESRVMTSSDGITWTSRTYAADNAWTGVTYGNGRFVAVAYFGNGNRVMTSGPPAATNVLVVSGTSITATTPPGAAGTASVLVTTAAGTNAANTLYTYADPTYSVTYNGNASTGGSVPTDGSTYANGATVTVLGNSGSLAKTGYTFDGWNTLANGGGTAQAAASTFTMGGAAVTLYAQWITAAVNGACATVAATAFAPTTGLCTQGSAPGSATAGSPWTWSCTGSGGGTTASCSAPNAVTATGSGSARASISGGTWVVDAANSGFSAAPSLPPGTTFPHGLLNLKLTAGVAGSTATVVIAYSSALPAGTVYWKYGRTASNTTAHWYPFAGAVIAGNTITLTLTDGADGDDDMTANGVITDPGGPGLLDASAATSIPTLSEWGMLILAGLMGLFGMWRLRLLHPKYQSGVYR